MSQGTPPPPMREPEPTSRPTNNMALAALLVGIAAYLVLCLPFGPILALLVAIVAIVLGIAGRKKAREEQLPGEGMALAGIILGAVNIVLVVVLLILMAIGITLLGEGMIEGMEQQEPFEEQPVPAPPTIPEPEVGTEGRLYRIPVPSLRIVTA